MIRSAPLAVRDWSTPRYLFVGLDWERKNGQLVLDAFAQVRVQHPDAELVEPTSPPRLLGINKAVYGKVPTVQSRGLVFGEAMTFIGLLGLGYAYAWRKGIFRWR